MSTQAVLSPGERVQFDEQPWTVTALVGTSVRLASDAGQFQIVLLSHLLGAVDFALLDAQPMPTIEPTGLLEALPVEVVETARDWERHVVEVETGCVPGAENEPFRDGYDPTKTTLTVREQAKVAELNAAGRPTSLRTLRRMRTRYRDQGLWGLVDQRQARISTPHGRLDERVVAAMQAAIAAETSRSTGDRGRLRRAVKAILDERHGVDAVPLPPQTTFYRALRTMTAGRYTFADATLRRTTALQPDGPFTPTVATRPGEIVQLDTTPLDVMAMLDDGVPGRVELTIALDVATRTICAAVLRPRGTKAVDAALLLARALVPEPMRPGWSSALRMAHSRIPHARLLDLDARLEHAAARPVIAPETVVVDRGAVFISETFLRACRTLGISVQPAHPATPTDKGIVERTFRSINSLFCQHVAGYTGRNVANRGTKVDASAVWSLTELQELLDEWVLCWQNRPHDGLRDPALPATALSPNDMYAALITAAGYVPLPLAGTDYIELMPADWRRINAEGIQLDYRTYNCAALNPYRHQPSGLDTKGGRWELHFDPYDLSHIWVRNTRHGGWITVPWTHLPMVGQPFADFTWRAARQLVAEAGGDDTHETAVARALDTLLTRAADGPPAQRRIVARTKAATTSTLPSAVAPLALPAAPEPEPEPAAAAPTVVPFGVFDPAAEEPYR